MVHMAPIDLVALGPKSTYRFRYWSAVGTEIAISQRLDELWKDHSTERAELSDSK